MTDDNDTVLNEQGEATQLDTSTYDILRTRLSEHAAELARRAEALNTARLEVFGHAELRLMSTDRIRTHHNCVPRDIASVGGHMLFGYNVFLGLKSETAVEDVFSLQRYSQEPPTAESGDNAGIWLSPAQPDDLPGLLRDSQFQRDFAELYRYYQQTQLVQLRRIDNKLLAVFAIGPRAADSRVLRWQINTDGSVNYLDNRGEDDDTFPPSHDFEWTPTTRDHHVSGRHPHISIEDEVFVETVGGDLTIKIENNTETGEGIYQEPVVEKLQSLADADVQYARIGSLILLRIQPYKEEQWRYLIFNIHTKEVVRRDSIGQACQRLPEDHGLIFPDGYYLSTGVTKAFDTEIAGLTCERVIRSPNGEDVLYVFHARREGRTLLLPYNVIRKEISTPIPCHGYSLFDDGVLVVFRAVSDEPTRVHPMQIWQTPFISDAYAAATPVGDGPLERVGNADLVRGISDCLSVVRTIDELTPTAAIFDVLMASCTRISDYYHWLAEPELGDLHTPLTEIRATAEQALNEYEKVQSLTDQAASALADMIESIAGEQRRARGEAPKTADDWIAVLAELRHSQGRLMTLRDTRYIDVARIDQLATALESDIADAGRRAVAFFRDEQAFASYEEQIDRLIAESQASSTVADAARLAARTAELTTGLETLIEIITTLDIADAPSRTAILQRIGEVSASLNRARALAAGRQTELRTTEAQAQFAAEFALFTQTIIAGLASANTPEQCDEQLGKLLLKLEDLESRFGEFNEFVSQLVEKRTDVYEAFSTKKQGLLDERARRADRLVESADRIITSVQRRTSTLRSLDEVNTYFASDPMLTKLRRLCDELRESGQPVQAEELAGRIKALRLEAGRALRDRLDLYVDGGDSIRLGLHRFATNSESIDVTLVPTGGELAFAITATDYRAPVRDEAFAATKPFWDELVVSESRAVYRGEHLAGAILADAEASRNGLSLDALHEMAMNEEKLLQLVRGIAERRYDEGYERGVHDRDATAILSALLRLHASVGLLRYPARSRAAAALFWACGADKTAQQTWARRAESLSRARATFQLNPAPASEVTHEAAGSATIQSDDQLIATDIGWQTAMTEIHAELRDAVGRFLKETGIVDLCLQQTVDFCPQQTLASGPDSDTALALTAEYLIEEIVSQPVGFVTSAPARTLLDRFWRSLGGRGAQSRQQFEDDLRSLTDLGDRYRLATAWLESFVASTTSDDQPIEVVTEAVAVLLTNGLPRHDSSAALTARVEGLLGSHPRIHNKTMDLSLDEFLPRTREFRAKRIPAYRAYQKRRAELLAAERQRLRLDEYRPKVMNAFVRNQLLDQVYLPLIADNLAKQLGAQGDAKRTDTMGLLLLISPPGYGKTTLMEYIASRLGLVFVKVNGPALGRNVTSLDPAEAPNATARQEIAKISFALEMGNNVLLYLDDIQHTSPELLQKFISLCDASRRMEGVWEGKTRTYDLRGKRFAVCMAGNPYTESGQQFQIPDMLANRADVWNLGDILSGRDELFALSYIENSLTSNPVLAPLSTREPRDVELLVRMAQGASHVAAEELSHPYSAVERDQILAVLRTLLRVQQVVLAVNKCYIASAAQADSSRTEPPFGLQGSYRNMNKLAERIVPIMADAEIDAMIDDHYLGEAQTLGARAEANLLKLAELRGTMSPRQAKRWAEVKAGYLRERATGGTHDDPVGRVVGAVSLLTDQVGAVETVLERAAKELTSGPVVRTTAGSGSAS